MFYDKNMNYSSEPGVFEIFIGGNSTADYKETFELIN